MIDAEPATDAGGAGPGGTLTPEAFDDLIDEATHAVNNLIPNHALAVLSDGERSKLLVEINDALTAILNEYVPKDL